MKLNELIEKINEKKKELLKKIDQLKKNCYVIIDNKDSPIKKKLADEVKSRLETIEKFLIITRYNLFFNGEVGIGKTTVISMLLGLIDEKANQVKKYALLPTASGRTTLCETNIVLGSKYLISFESVSNECFDDFLRDWVNISKNGLKNNDEKIELTIEIYNWLVHSMGFSDRNDDKLEQLINNAKDGNDLYDKAKKLINYANRKQIINEEFTSENFFKCYKELNNGKNKIYKMPEKITLTIPIENSDLMSIVYSITDTKGIESPARIDIRNNIKLYDSISIICEHINNFGSNSVVELLKPVLKLENRDYKYRVMLLGIYKDDELTAVNDADDNIENGKNLKIKEAQDVFKNNNIGFNKDNYLFYNALNNRYKNDDGSPNLNNIKEDSEEFFKNIIDKTVNNMVNKYDIELSEIETFLKKINNGNVNDKFEKSIDDLKKIINTLFGEWKNNNKIIWESFQSELNNKNKISCASALRGAVNHNGCGNSSNIYETMKDGASVYYTKTFMELKIRIEEKFNLITPFNNEIEDTCFDFIKNLIINDYYDECYFRYIDNVDSENKDLMNNNNFWIQPKNYWGDGKGNYTERVHEFIKNGLENEDKVTHDNIIGKYDDRKNKEFLYEYFEKIMSLLRYE